MTGNTPAGGPRVPPGGSRYTSGRWPEAALALGPSPLLTHGGFSAPMGFQEFRASDLTDTAGGGATRRAPRMVGTGQPLPYSALSTVATSIWSRPGSSRPGTKAPSRWLPLRKGKRSRQPPGTQTPAARPRPRNVRAALTAGPTRSRRAMPTATRAGPLRRPDHDRNKSERLGNGPARLVREFRITTGPSLSASAAYARQSPAPFDWVGESLHCGTLTPRRQHPHPPRGTLRGRSTHHAASSSPREHPQCARREDRNPPLSAPCSRGL